jgi:hypothetical protein
VNRQLVKVLAVAVVGAVLVVVPSAAGASVAAANSSCKFLKASEVARAIGTKVKKGPNPPGPSTTQVCSYIPRHSTLPSSVNVWVQSGDASAIGFSTAKTAFKANIESTHSLGSKSFYVGGGINTAYVLKGNTLVYVQYVNLQGDAAKIKTAVIKLTKLVLHRV